ncbi:unnamed protein product [Caenorhabditis auriculariae]|uniref:Chromo domain-containing protein n=1 Tax=Caenorhabditis auriculariae TaxID=2777116 RepID=A0A8S1HC66_9PELO|nr:unnamed protein product [Caenorhabditis auriculariae]
MLLATPQKEKDEFQLRRQCQKVNSGVSKKRTRVKSSRTTVRKSKKVRTNKDEIDFEVYEVENLVDVKVEGEAIKYVIKWKGWAATDNSVEEETSRRISNSTVPGNADFLNDILPWATFIENALRAGSLRYMLHNSVSSKRKLVTELISSHKMEWMLADTRRLTQDSRDFCESHYMQDLLFLRIDHYPQIGVELNDGEEDWSGFVPCWPPLTNLLWRPLSEQQFRECELKGRSLDGVSVDFLVNEKSLVQRATQVFRKAVNGTNREVPSRFKLKCVVLKLERSSWQLRAGGNINRNEEILPFGGILRKKSVAEESMTNEGAMLALSSFFNVPGTPFCLDRRENYDLSKFIQHSCHPNCGVKLKWGEYDDEVAPTLVLYALSDIMEEEVLTVDFFKRYEDKVEAFFRRLQHPVGRQVNTFKRINLLERKIDHVSCECGVDECREILYVCAENGGTGGQEIIKKIHDFEGLEIVDIKTEAPNEDLPEADGSSPTKLSINEEVAILESPPVKFRQIDSSESEPDSHPRDKRRTRHGGRGRGKQAG